MIIFDTKKMLVFAVAFLSASIGVMETKASVGHGYVSKKITRVVVSPPSKWMGSPLESNPIQRVYILPYSSTGPAASVKTNVLETSGLILNGFGQVAWNQKNREEPIIVELRKPIEINVESKNPELSVIVERERRQGKERILTKRVFDEEYIDNDKFVGEDNTLFIMPQFSGEKGMINLEKTKK